MGGVGQAGRQWTMTTSRQASPSASTFTDANRMGTSRGTCVVEPKGFGLRQVGQPRSWVTPCASMRAARCR
jgi:hypothetical protein